MRTYTKRFWRKVILALLTVLLLLGIALATIITTHRPGVLWNMVASLYIKPPSAASIAGGFTTLPPGAALPTEQECAARVKRSSWEPRSDNTAANQHVPTQEQIALLTPWNETIGVDLKRIICSCKSLATSPAPRTKYFSGPPANGV